jgi:hypothetical protein
MHGLDIFVISFGVAFFVASDRFKRGMALLRARHTRASRTR